MRFFAIVFCCLLAADASAVAQTSPPAGDTPTAQPPTAQADPSPTKPAETAAPKPAQASTGAPPPATPSETASSTPAEKSNESTAAKIVETTADKPVVTSVEPTATPPVETPAAEPIQAATVAPAAQPETPVTSSDVPAGKPVETSIEKPAAPKVATAPVTQPEETPPTKPVESLIEKPVALPPDKPVAVTCPGHPDALGTSRVITVSADAFQRIGSMQYKQELPLKDHEVVLTFDDGPIPPYTTVILDELAAQCVKATYFLVGEMAHNFPYLVRRIYNAGHTIGTHSQDHPLGFQRLSEKGLEKEIDGGIDSVKTALGDPKALAPFFRIPGLGRSDTNEKFLAERSLVTWSADVVADDWHRGIRPNQIVERAMKRLNEKGRGILLLHDIHPATAIALPTLLKELKEQGYRVVQVVPGGDRPASLPELVAAHEDKNAWPRILQAEEKAEKTGARGTRHKHRSAARHHRHQSKKHAIKRSHHKRRVAAK